MQGTGMKVLKDQNLISINKMEMERGKDRAFELHTEARVLLLGQMDEDSKVLMRNGLIDYSVFLLQVDRQKMIENALDSHPLLMFDSESHVFKVSFPEIPTVVH